MNKRLDYKSGRGGVFIDSPRALSLSKLDYKFVWDKEYKV